MKLAEKMLKNCAKRFPQQQVGAYQSPMLSLLLLSAVTNANAARLFIHFIHSSYIHYPHPNSTLHAPTPTHNNIIVISKSIQLNPKQHPLISIKFQQIFQSFFKLNNLS